MMNCENPPSLHLSRERACEEIEKPHYSSSFPRRRESGGGHPLYRPGFITEPPQQIPAFAGMTKYYSVVIVFYNAVTSAIRLSRSETPDLFTRSFAGITKNRRASRFLHALGSAGSFSRRRCIARRRPGSAPRAHASACDVGFRRRRTVFGVRRRGRSCGRFRWSPRIPGAAAQRGRGLGTSGQSSPTPRSGCRPRPRTGPRRLKRGGSKTRRDGRSASRTGRVSTLLRP